MAAKEIVCAMCGFKNAANLARCVSCGAKLEAHSAVDYTEEEAAARETGPRHAWTACKGVVVWEEGEGRG